MLYCMYEYILVMLTKFYLGFNDIHLSRYTPDRQIT